MSDILERIKEAQAIVNGDRDNLLEAIAALSAFGQIDVIPRDDRMAMRPIIMLPQRFYDRMLFLYGKKDEVSNDT